MSVIANLAEEEEEVSDRAPWNRVWFFCFYTKIEDHKLNLSGTIQSLLAQSHVIKVAVALTTGHLNKL